MGCLVRMLADWTPKGIYLCSSMSYLRTLTGLVLCSGRRGEGQDPTLGA